MGTISHFDLFLMVGDGCVAGHNTFGQIILFEGVTLEMQQQGSDKTLFFNAKKQAENKKGKNQTENKNMQKGCKRNLIL